MVGITMFVMLSVHVHTCGKLKSLLDRDGNRTRELWALFASSSNGQCSTNWLRSQHQKQEFKIVKTY